MDVLRQAFSVLLVFSLLGAVLWALGRAGKVSFPGLSFAGLMGRGLARKRALGNSRSMIAVERLTLTPQHTLHLVRINGEDVLVATHPLGCSVVTTVTERAMGAQA
jgi:hypothetical protein